MEDQTTQGSQGEYQRPAPIDVSSLGLTCTMCGAKIDTLPFQPTKREDGTYGRLYCKGCNAKRPRRPFSGGGRGFGGGNRGFGGGDRGGYRPGNQY